MRRRGSRLHRRIASVWADKLGKHQNAVASFEKILEAEPGDTETADAPERALREEPVVAAADRGAAPRAAARRRRRPPRAPRRDGAPRRRAPERRARGDHALQPGAGDRAAGPGGAGRAGDAVRARAALAGAGRDSGPAARERRGQPGRRAAAARTPRHVALRTDGRVRGGDRRVPAHPGAGPEERARRPRAARDLRASRRLRRARVALRRAGGLRRAVRPADLAGRSHRRHGRAHAAAGARGDAGAGEAESARSRAEGLRADPDDGAAQPQGGAGADPALPGPARSGRACWRRTRRCWARRRPTTASARRSGWSCSPRRGRSAKSAWARRRWPTSGARARSRSRPRIPTSAPTWNGWPGEADEWGALAGAYEERFKSSTDAEERIWLLRRVLRISATRLFRPVETRRAAEQILAELGYDEEADTALEQVLVQSKAWPELAKLLHGRADRAPDAAERVKLLLRIAQIEEERVADLAAAAATWTAIVDADPTNERARRALVRVSEARQDWSGVVEALRRELTQRGASMEAREREELLLRIAHLQETRLEDRPSAFASYREVLLANPHAAPAVAGLERMAGIEQADKAEIARLTLPYYERTDNAAKLAAANAALLAVADSVGERVERLEKLRALYGGPLKDPAAAYHAAASLFDIDPSDVENREALVGFAAEASLTGELADKLSATADTTTDRNLKRDLLVLVAELQEKQLGRAAEAERVYAQILAAEPLHTGAFKALARLYRDGQRWSAAARAAGRPPARVAGRQGAAGPAGGDRRAGRGVAGRHRPRAWRLREDDRAGPRRAAGVQGARTALRRQGALGGSGSAAGQPRGSGLRRRGAGAGVPPRRAARLAPRRRRRRPAIAGGDRQGRPAARRGAPPAGEAAVGARPAPARREDPRAGLRGRAARGPGWSRSSRCSARRWKVRRAPGCSRGSPSCRRTGCRRARWRWPPGGRSWPPTRTTPRRWRRSSGWGPRWIGSPSWSTSTRTWRSGATPPTWPAAPTCWRARRASTPAS